MKNRNAPAVLGGILLLAGGATLGVWQLSGPRPAPTPPQEAKDVAELTTLLESRGVALHAAALARNGPCDDRAYLTDAERPWAELSRLPAVREKVGQWRGVVMCEKVVPGSTPRVHLEVWGDAYLEAPPWIFFGDPDLRKRIGEALAAP
jgi:hypothetical protein